MKLVETRLELIYNHRRERRFKFALVTQTCTAIMQRVTQFPYVDADGGKTHGKALRKNNDYRVTAEDGDGAMREDPGGDVRVAQQKQRGRGTAIVASRGSRG